MRQFWKTNQCFRIFVWFLTTSSPQRPITDSCLIFVIQMLKLFSTYEIWSRLILEVVLRKYLFFTRSMSFTSSHHGAPSSPQSRYYCILCTPPRLGGLVRGGGWRRVQRGLVTVFWLWILWNELLNVGLGANLMIDCWWVSKREIIAWVMEHCVFIHLDRIRVGWFFLKMYYDEMTV